MPPMINRSYQSINRYFVPVYRCTVAKSGQIWEGLARIALSIEGGGVRVRNIASWLWWRGWVNKWKHFIPTACIEKPKPNRSPFLYFGHQIS
jgi:hypothetical protein